MKAINFAPIEEPIPHQVVGRVKAYQAYDGYPIWEDDRAEWDWDTAHTPTGGSNWESYTMDESLMSRRRVKDEGVFVVNFFCQSRDTLENKHLLISCQQPR